jgi:hypothetical protein
MARKNRSLRTGNPKPVDIDVVGLYDELAPSWSLGSPDAPPPAWSRAVFGGGKRHLPGWEFSADGNIMSVASMP